jgi:hypothetical protein
MPKKKQHATQLLQHYLRICIDCNCDQRRYDMREVAMMSATLANILSNSSFFEEYTLQNI